MFNKILILSLLSFVSMNYCVASDNKPKSYTYTREQLLAINYLIRGRITPQVAIEHVIKNPGQPHVCDGRCMHPHCDKNKIVVAKKDQSIVALS